MRRAAGRRIRTPLSRSGRVADACSLRRSRYHSRVMKVSLRWLRDYVSVDAPAADIGERLTMAGLEVEGVSRVGGHLDTVVVAEVVERQPHPRADKLSLVTINDGVETVTVVCGAPNVPPPGGRVCWARPGTRLPGGLVETRPVRGVSSPGMLCSETELEVGDDPSGILILEPEARPGTPLFGLFGDEVLEVAVTTNRPDALGHLGIAREVAALFGLPLRRPEVALDAYLGEIPVAERARLTLEDPVGCPRYTARVVLGTKVGPSPRWLQVRLRAVGVRPISNVVDVTNFVLMEYGQPLHAFDRTRLADAAIVVRRAHAGERMVTLDEQERLLDPGDVLICDAARPVAIAGVMGGRDTEVGPDTTEVLIESAAFAPTAIRRTARRLGLHTEASYRFERGTDPNLVDEASARAARLMAELGGGRVCPGLLDAYPHPVAPARVTLRMSHVRRLLGLELAPGRVGELLGAIGLTVAPAAPGTLAVTVPTFRPDLTREADLCEEIVRLHGLDAIPATIPLTARAPRASGDPVVERTRDVLAAAGLDEIISLGFTASRKLAALLAPEEEQEWRTTGTWPSGRAPVTVRNPLREDDSVMRTSLLPGLLDALRLNRDRGSTEVRLFEVGTVFLPRADAALPDERRTVAGIVAGTRDAWLAEGEPVDFYDAKGAVERVAALLGLDLTLVAPATVAYLHPGQSADLRAGERLVGHLGQVHPRVRRAFGLEEPCFCFELDLVETVLPVRRFEELPRFPAVVRDLSFFVDEEVPAARIAAAIAAHDDELRRAVAVREDYREAGKVPPGRKGMLWSITYRAAERTLTDEEVNACQGRLVEHLRRILGIEVR
jgi:phenylalanyl-tRNA synthetase beta chain